MALAIYMGSCVSLLSGLFQVLSCFSLAWLGLSELFLVFGDLAINLAIDLAIYLGCYVLF